MTLDIAQKRAIPQTRGKGECTLQHLYISPAHNFFGHHGRPAGSHPMIEVPSIECIAGAGIWGDRFFDHKENYKGQITFFAIEVYEFLCERLKVFDRPPGAFRRNVVTRGLDLNSLIGREFVIQGARFLGTEECKPCYWMDQAFAPGAEALLRGRGGLRAAILTSGTLTRSVGDDFPLASPAAPPCCTYL